MKPEEFKAPGNESEVDSNAAEHLENKRFLDECCKSIEEELIKDSNGQWKKGDPVFIQSAGDDEQESAGISWEQNRDIANEEFEFLGNAVFELSKRIGLAAERGLEVEVTKNASGYGANAPKGSSNIKTEYDLLVERLRNSKKQPYS